MYISLRTQEERDENPKRDHHGVAHVLVVPMYALLVAGASRCQEVPGLLGALPKMLPDKGPKVTSARPRKNASRFQCRSSNAA